METLTQAVESAMIHTPYITPEQLAKRWGVSEMTLRRWRKQGKLKASTFGRGIRFSRAYVLEEEAKRNEDALTPTEP